MRKFIAFLSLPIVLSGAALDAAIAASPPAVAAPQSKSAQPWVAAAGPKAALDAGKSWHRERTPPTLDLALPNVARAPLPAGVTTNSNSREAATIAVDLPDLGTAGRSREPTKAETIVARAPRDGVPVLTLLENNSTLVHIGLNTHARPGLWIIEKLP